MLKPPLLAAAPAAVVAAEGAIPHHEDAAVDLIRKSAFEFACKAFPKDQVRNWAVQAIRNGFPVAAVIEGAAMAIGDQLAGLAFVLQSPEAAAPSIALISQTRMRDMVETAAAAIRKAAEEKGKIDAAVRS